MTDGPPALRHPGRSTSVVDPSARVSDPPELRDTDRNKSPSKRTLRIMFISKSHLPHVGGSEISTHHLVRELVRRGHDPSVLTRLSRRSTAGLFDVCVDRVGGGPRRHVDDILGYTTIRSTRPSDVVEPIVHMRRPDAVVVTATDPTFATRARELTGGYPTVLYI